MALFLTNAASYQRSPGHSGSGACYAAMAKPPRYALQQGRCDACAPLLADLEAWQHKQINTDTYFLRFGRLLQHRMDREMLKPGRLVATARAVQVRDGDTMICTCPRPDSPRRSHPCHLEALAPVLVAAGWEIILYGQPYPQASLHDAQP